MRQTWEEIGIDLAEPCYTSIGQLDDREITTSLGKRLLMILSPFVFLQVTPHAPPPDPVPSTTLHWTPLSELISQHTPIKWSSVTVDAASRVAPKHSAVLRLLVRIFIGSMEFPAIVLHPSSSSIESASAFPSQDQISEKPPKTQNGFEKGLPTPSKPASTPTLKLWGLSLGMTLELMSYMILPAPSVDNPRALHIPSRNGSSSGLASGARTPPSPLSEVMQLPYQNIVEDFRMEYVAPSLASVFPRFSYPDVNFWIW